MSEVTEEVCEYGVEGCNEDNPESYCEQHRTDAAESYAEGMQETYDY